MSKIFNNSIIRKLSSFDYTIIYKTLNIKNDIINFIIVNSEKDKIYALQTPNEDFKNTINNILSLIEDKTFYYKRFNNANEIEEVPIKLYRIKSNSKYFEIKTDYMDNLKIENKENRGNAEYTHLVVKMLGIGGDAEIIQYIYDHDFLYYSYCILQIYLSNISSIYTDFKDKFNNITIKEFKAYDKEDKDYWNNFDDSLIKAFEYIGCDILPIEDRTSVVNCELFVMGE